MKSVVCALVLASGVGAAAQDIEAGIDPQTQAGLLSIEESSDGFSRVLVVGSKRFSFEGEYQYINIADKRGSLYLVELGAGGNACPAVYVWLHTNPTARVSEVFGNCAYMDEVNSDSETVTVVMASGIAADGRVGFYYDGKVVSEVPLGQVSAGVGLDPRAWIGRTPYEIFADADWRPGLVALMGEEDYRRVGRVMERSSGFEPLGDWVVADGFNPMADARAVMAMHVGSGQVVVAMQSGPNVREIWGDEAGGLPEDVNARLDFR